MISRMWPQAAPSMKNDQPMAVANQKPPPKLDFVHFERRQGHRQSSL
jgi:hypothetical protein